MAVNMGAKVPWNRPQAWDKMTVFTQRVINDRNQLPIAGKTAEDTQTFKTNYDKLEKERKFFINKFKKEHFDSAQKCALVANSHCKIVQR